MPNNKTCRKHNSYKIQVYICPLCESERTKERTDIIKEYSSLSHKYTILKKQYQSAVEKLNKIST